MTTVSAAEAGQDDDLLLEHQLCFALTVASRSVVGAYKPVLEKLGLTHPQYLVMLALWDHQRANPGTRSPLSVKQIATALQLDSATLSPMLKRLEALGLISRSRSAADERSTEVELTDDGTALRERALSVPDAVVARLGVDLAELEELHRVLSSINAAALAAGALRQPTED